MHRTRIILDPEQFPPAFRPLLADAKVYDSSCSSMAKVWFLDKEGGYYLKSAPKGTLENEASLTRFFHGKGLGPEMLAYESLDRDWLLTARVPGEDCIHPMYLEDPVRLCDTTAQLLRMLHETDHTGCPISDRTVGYLAAAEQNHRAGKFDHQLFPEGWGFPSPEDAWRMVQEHRSALKSDTLLHGDYCLPNIMLDNWRFAGFVDLDAGGVGDRHVDLFWGMWSLNLNLKTMRYCQRFLDVYGRDAVEPGLLRTIAAIEAFL